MTRNNQFTLVIQSIGEGDNDHHMRRLRALLKACLRVYRFRCISIEPTEAIALLGDAPEATGRTQTVSDED